MEVNSLSAFLTDLGSMLTAAIGWMGDLLEFVTGNPVILVPLLVFFVTGGVIGLVMRILRG